MDVDVSQIVEFPTQMGNKCRLLERFGLNSYLDTEEAIYECLTSTAEDRRNLEYCLQNGCSAFYEEYLKGNTPFKNKDPIRLIKYQGKYWVVEGKHRVCLAKRLGIEKIEANVASSREDQSLLELVGEPGKFQSTYTVTEQRGKVNFSGETLCLWVFPPAREVPWDIAAVFSFGQILWLTRHTCKGNNLADFVPGIDYAIRVKEKKTGFWFNRKKTIQVQVTVHIETHPKTKVWLLRFKVDNSLVVFQPSENATLYRRGMWRKYHLNNNWTNGFTVTYI